MTTTPGQLGFRHCALRTNRPESRTQPARVTEMIATDASNRNPPSCIGVHDRRRNRLFAGRLRWRSPTHLGMNLSQSRCKAPASETECKTDRRQTTSYESRGDAQAQRTPRQTLSAPHHPPPIQNAARNKSPISTHPKPLSNNNLQHSAPNERPIKRLFPFVPTPYTPTT